MWTITTDGFFSVVEHNETFGMLVVKARNAEHLENLKNSLKKMAGDFSGLEITTSNEHDYVARMNIPRHIWINYLVSYVQELSYTGHVKDVVVEATGDPAFGDALYSSWDALLQYQRQVHPGSGFGHD